MIEISGAKNIARPAPCTSCGSASAAIVRVGGKAGAQKARGGEDQERCGREQPRIDAGQSFCRRIGDSTSAEMPYGATTKPAQVAV